MQLTFMGPEIDAWSTPIFRGQGKEEDVAKNLRKSGQERQRVVRKCPRKSSPKG